MCGGYYPNWMMGWGGWWLWDLFWLVVLLVAVYLVVRIASRTRSRNSVFPGAHCPSCDSPIEAAFLRCPECGHQLKQNCPECGKIVKTKWNTCPYCEIDLKAEYTRAY